MWFSVRCIRSSNGRLNATVRCSREGLPGSISMLADGRFEAESLDYQRELSTALSGDGAYPLTPETKVFSS